jgi:hypothetical protein
MLARGEFGFPMNIGIRKSKASPAQMCRRRVKRYTRVCANVATAQMSRNRRRVLRTKFDPHETQKQTKK